MGEVTLILEALLRGERQTTDQLVSLVYDELRQLAARGLANELPGQTLQATELVHEACLRLVGSEAQTWEGRRYFFGAAWDSDRTIGDGQS